MLLRVLLSVAPGVATVLRRPLDSEDALEALKSAVFLLSFLSNPNTAGGDLALPGSGSTSLDVQLLLWVPLFLARLFPAGAKADAGTDAAKVEAWQVTHDFALQLLLKLVANYGDAFRAVVNQYLPPELRSRLEMAVTQMRERQHQQERLKQQEAAAAAKSKTAGKRKKSKF